MVSLFVLSIISCNHKKKTKLNSPNKELSITYKKYLDSCIHATKQIGLVTTKVKKQGQLLEAREYFKKLEPIFLTFERNNYNVLNAPNILKISEEDITDIKIIKPKGFQVLEELLFSDEKNNNSEITKNIEFILSKLGYISQNNFIENRSKTKYLEMFRISIINNALRGITGYDSPVLANSLNETKWNYEGMISYLKVLKPFFKNEKLINEIIEEFTVSIKILRESQFNTFDRYHYIITHIQPQLKLINAISLDWEVSLNKHSALSTKSTKIFSKEFFNEDNFVINFLPNKDTLVTTLGSELFYDTNLSKKGNMSCATCHKPELAFTDGFAKAIGNNNQVLLRNSPTIIYSQYQRNMFHDARVSSLESQISSVIKSKDEFHQNINHIVEYVLSNKAYNKKFKAYYKDSVTSLNIRHAISNYTRSLAKFNSKFDENIKGEKNTLNVSEKRGFNLFMGKAACATCHFPPLFNGTVPPFFKETELEIIGVPKTDQNKELDEDLGRYYYFKTEERKGAFKTPTLRNIAKTAPYMHNGIYNTLEDVMDFYNKGGGAGLGLDVPHQTLPFDSLELSEAEIKDVIAFMKTLTDSEDTNYK